MELCPVGLSKDQFAILSEGTQYTEGQSWAELLRSVDLKLAQTMAMSTQSAYVNLPLARALAERIQSLHTRWEEVPEHARPWCKAMVHYFLQDSDSDPDYGSPIGFEDDVDVLNACVRLAGMLDLVLNPEDFDDA